jgi:hypothetical protein
MQQVVQKAQIRARWCRARRSRGALRARKNSNVNRVLSERAEESAEQILARLERYLERMRERPTTVAPMPAVDRRAHVVATEFAGPALTPAVITAPRVRPAPPVDTLIPSHEGAPLRHNRFVAEVAPALVAVTVCSFVILLTAWFAVGVAAAVCGALLLCGVVGLFRRVPLARAYTFGLVVAALLIRLS